MLELFQRHTNKIGRVVFFLLGLSILFSGMRAYDEGTYAYSNYFGQPVVREMAIVIGALFVLGSVIPQSVYERIREKARKKMKKSRKRRLLDRKTAKKRTPGSSDRR